MASLVLIGQPFLFVALAGSKVFNIGIHCRCYCVGFGDLVYIWLVIHSFMVYACCQALKNYFLLRTDAKFCTCSSVIQLSSSRFCFNKQCFF